MSSSNQPPRTSGPIEHYDAVVIGAGVSGMYALHHLREMGFSVRVYDGASVHFLDRELQRILRDVQMISAHTIFDVDLAAEQCGRALLEGDAPLQR